MKIIKIIKLFIDCKIFKAYSSIEFCPVWNFFKTIETNDLRYILKLKDYEILPNTDFKPIENWDKLYNEYSKDAGETEMSNYIASYSGILINKKLIIYLQHIVYLLSIKENKELIDFVKKIGYKFNYTNQSEYADAVIGLNNQIVGLCKNIEKKSFEFQEKYKTKGEVVSIYRILSAFEHYKGIHISPFTTTVKQFLNIKKEYAEWVKHKTKPVNGR